jgi:tetratricopeptide (TPR) repeat protein
MHLSSVVLVLAAALGGPALAEREKRDPAATGQRLVLQGRHREATLFLLSALKTAPADSRLWYFLGKAYNAQRQHAEALEALRMAGKLRLDTPLLHQQLGDALLGLGRPKEALAELAKGPDSPPNRMARALALVQLQRPAEALPLLEKALAEAPGLEPRIRLLRASALTLMGKHAEASRELAAGRRAAAGTPWARVYGSLQDASTSR